MFPVTGNKGFLKRAVGAVVIMHVQERFFMGIGLVMEIIGED